MSDKSELFKKPTTRYVKQDVIEIDGKFVRDLRLSLSLTQAAFASTLGVTKKSVEKWEQGKNKVSGPAKKLMCLLKSNHHLLDELSEYQLDELHRNPIKMDSSSPLPNYSTPS